MGKVAVSPVMRHSCSAVLGPQVEGLRVPPFQQSEEVEAFSAEALISVPVDRSSMDALCEVWLLRV